MRQAWLGILLLGLSGGCVRVDESEPDSELLESTESLGDDELAEGEDPEIVQAKAGSCGQRWTLPAAVAEASRSQRVGYDSAGRSCSGGATEGAELLGAYLREHFGDAMNLRVDGRGVQIYACRRVRGGSSLSVHATGRALDVFIPTQGGAADNAKGDRIANWLVQHAEEIGVQMIIWDRTTWRPGGVGSCYTGQHPHNDHIHVELTRTAASLQTPFFRGSIDDSPDPAPAPNPGTEAWIGAACNSDAQCGFSHEGKAGRCYLGRDPARGVCALPCEGFCPDRQGWATTFCADARDLGASAGAGWCLAASGTANDSCTRVAGQEEIQADRWIGASRAPAANREVCAPKLAAQPDPDPQPNPEPDPDPTPQEPAPETDVCGVPGLEMSDHGLPCNVGEDVWRCACSQRFEVTISQVCRSQRWVTYHTEPRACTQCSGEYSSACE